MVQRADLTNYGIRDSNDQPVEFKLIKVCCVQMKKTNVSDNSQKYPLGILILLNSKILLGPAKSILGILYCHLKYSLQRDEAKALNGP